ncbi:LytTR family transcriptional regulator [Pseudotenacibaculum sp. MALMAid0570]|uniref:LytTR family transcriptional regulator n=1 Tax=Pseudotenacibaculum sp. MALMAid0570 TaxID=3143938 RepID=UPI0032DF6426
MKNYRYYIYTVVTLFIFSVLATFLGFPYISKIQGVQLLENEIVAAQQQAKQISMMAGGAYENQLDKSKIAESIHKSIEGTEDHNIFLSVIDWSNNIISHPDITLVGSKNIDEGSARNMETAPVADDLYELILTFKKSESEQTEILYTTAIKNTGWIVVAYVNISKVVDQLNQQKNQMYLIFCLMMLVLTIVVLGIVRIITGYYENQLSLKNLKLEDGVLNLTKLNDSLENYQKKLNEITSFKNAEAPTIETVKEKEKQRILTYVRNELMPVSTEDIGYIYVENTITYVVQKDGKRSTTSESLDQIYSYLDEKSFFRANRQIIVAISAINKIIKFGNSKLKIQVDPPSEIDIIIGKNKAAAFKQWLDL